MEFTEQLLCYLSDKDFNSIEEVSDSIADYFFEDKSLMSFDDIVVCNRLALDYAMIQ